MTPQQADKLIKRGKEVRFYHKLRKESFVGVPVERGLRLIAISQNGDIQVYYYADLNEVFARVLPDGTLINPV